jgi:hypothetical protein
VLLLGVVSIRGRRRNCWQGGLKAQTISWVLTTLLSSMYAPIVLLAFVIALVCVAFAFKEPEDES